MTKLETLVYEAIGDDLLDLAADSPSDSDYYADGRDRIKALLNDEVDNLGENLSPIIREMLRESIAEFDFYNFLDTVADRCDTLDDSY